MRPATTLTRATRCLYTSPSSSSHRHISSSPSPQPEGKGKAKAKPFDPVIFSGIQPTGTPHLGNLLGFFLPYLELQQSSPSTTPLFLSIVGLHAITLPQNPRQLVEDRRNMLAALLASGVDPKRTCLYFQEDVPEHAELAWYLNTLTPVGQLKRMTTWKSRLAVSRNANSTDEVSESDLRLGLLAYPVLQAADVMLYKSTIVPVGEDQQQHLELARDIAELFNNKFGPIFPLPEMRIVPSKRILSLRNPSEKMSKSSPHPSSRISITDDAATITKRLKSAVTDSEPSITFDPANRPGLANLLLIWSALDESGGSLGSVGKSRTPTELAQLANESKWGMGKLKQHISERIIERIEPIRLEYERIVQDHAYLAEVAQMGRQGAREVAAETMSQVRKAVGLGPL